VLETWNESEMINMFISFISLSSLSQLSGYFYESVLSNYNSLCTAFNSVSLMLIANILFCGLFLFIHAQFGPILFAFPYT
jgi:hypothetical protein